MESGQAQHFSRLLKWLDWESEAEKQQLDARRLGSKAEAEKSGDCLLDLVITHHEPGVGGEILLRLVKRNRTLSLPWNRLRVGTPVVLSAEDADPLRGVVTMQRRDSIEIAVSEWPEGERFRLDLSADEVTRKRLIAALTAARSARTNGTVAGCAPGRAGSQVFSARRL